MRILIVYASRYGATREIAQRIAFTVDRHGLDATVQPAQRADDPLLYDAVVIGSAMYDDHWMKPATKFVRRYGDTLAKLPVWIFSSGTLGGSADDSQRQCPHARPAPKEIAEFRHTIRPKGHCLFLGALDPNKLGFTQRLKLRLLAKRDNGPKYQVGDFRDWEEIETWAISIARELTPAVCAA
jgi:menaquinone-dependent protoporphyrinogen oxidase